MRRTMMTVLAVAAAALLAAPSLAAQPRGGMMGGGGWGQGQYGGGMGRGVGRGMGMMGGFGAQAPALDKPLTPDTAAARAASAVASWGYTDLTADEVLQFTDGFYVLEKEKSTGKAGLELWVNGRTGVVTPAWGPAMAWNTKYGRHAWTGAAPSATVNSAAAEKAVRDSLAAQGSTVAWTYKTVELPGYFSVRLVRDNRVEEIFLVNAASGVVTHGWRGGAFVALKDF
jgi:hypothetical protein